MHRNTRIFIIFLTILAALLFGINITRLLHPEKNNETIKQSNSSPVPSSNNLQLTTHNLKYCGLSFDYPKEFKITSASDSAQLVNNDTNENIDVGCAKEVPKIPLAKDKIEDATISGQKAKIYHDKSAKDGSPIDVAIFTNPNNKLEVALFGYGKIFEELLKTVKLTP